MPHNLNADKIISQLIKTAELNGFVSTDEQAMINSVKENIEKYYSIIDKNYEDGVITPEEEHKMYEIRKEILEEAIAVAKKDEKVTQDEFRLLQAIRSVISDLEADEHY